MWQEELDFLPRKLAKLRAENIMDADVTGVAGEVRDRERRVIVEVFRLDEALEEIPTHLGHGGIGVMACAARRMRLWDGRLLFTCPFSFPFILDRGDSCCVLALWQECWPLVSTSEVSNTELWSGGAQYSM